MPFPEASAVVVPLPSSIFHCAAKPVPGTPAVVMVRAMEADAEVPPPVAVMTMLELPGVAVAEAESVKVVLQVTVQLVEENEAVTPAGKADVVKDTAVALPETSLAVIISAADAPCPIDRLGEAADTEMVLCGGACGCAEAVVKV